jgi:Uma2 family endonuclease
MTLEESAMSSLAGYGPDPFTVESFRPWLDLRSPEEPWELIDGIAVMNPAPRVAHQRIARNFEFHLRLALARHKPEWSPDRGIGIDVANDSRYRPEPELTVVDMDIDPTQKLPRPLLHGRRGRSESDKGGPIEAKVAFYKDHPHTLWIAAIQQG